MKTFFGAFLDGFTAAGVARKISIPGEPILGFAPGSDTTSESAFADRTPRSQQRLIAETIELPLPVVEIRLAVESGSLVMITESVSGEVRKVHVEGNQIPSNLASVLQ